MKYQGNKVIDKFFPNSTTQEKAKYSCIYTILLWLFLFFILPRLLFFNTLMGIILGASMSGLFFPMFIHAIIGFVWLSVSDYEKIPESFRTTFFYFLYLIWIGYMGSTTNDEIMGGFLMRFFYNIHGDIW